MSLAGFALFSLSFLSYLSARFSSGTTVVSNSKHIWHKILKSNECKDKIIIIGDVHGCLDEVKLLLKKCNYDRDTSTVVFVGDLVNKGPYSAKIIEFVRNLGALCVRGNHDDAAIEFANGTITTKKSKYNYVKEWSQDDIAWLNNLPYTIHFPNHKTLIVHAGIVPDKALSQQSFVHMTRMRNLKLKLSQQEQQHCSDFNNSNNNSTFTTTVTTSNNSKKAKPIDNSKYEVIEKVCKPSKKSKTAAHDGINSDGEAWANVWSLLKEERQAQASGSSHSNALSELLLTDREDIDMIVFGHDAKRGLQLTSHAIGLDSGCCYGKKLSAYMLPDRQIIQVDALQEYVPAKLDGDD